MCCDVRRATIIVNIISIGIGFLGLLVLVFLTKNYADLNPDDYDDDAMKYEIYEIDQLAVGQFLGIGIGLTLSRMVSFEDSKV